MTRLGVVTGAPAGPAMRVADVGTGSGAVAIALAVALRRLHAADAVEIVATDISADALGLARENGVGHAVADRIEFIEADLLPEYGGLGGRSGRGSFEVILANLPYVRGDAMADLPRATTFEPRIALDGGANGLEVIGRLLDRLPAVLAPDGVALLEIGADHGEAIVALVAARLPGWRCDVELDLARLPRVARVSRSD
jgi:release factor glutamine methyltransferase